MIPGTPVAPWRSRRSSNAASTLAWTTGFLVGPALAGTALASPIRGGWFVVLAALAAAGALAAGALAARLPPAIDLVS